MLFRVLKIGDFPGFDPKALRHNLIMHIADGSIFAFGIYFVYAFTIIPVFIQQAGGNSIEIGSVPVLWIMGLSFPQLFFTNVDFTEKSIKSFVLKYAFLSRVMYLVIALFTFFILNILDRSIGVLLLLFLYFLTAAVGGIPIPGWFHLLSKTIPVKLRGRLLAVRQLIGSILALAAGSFTILILSAIHFPFNFAMLFLVAFIVMMISFFFLSRIKEDEEFYPEDTVRTVTNKLRAVKFILKTNLPFRNFLIADALVSICITATAFYPVFAMKEFNLPSSYAGTITIVATLGMIMGNIFLGYLADISGHKINLVILSIASLLASLTAIIANNIVAYSIVFFFVGIAISVLGISRLSYVTELCSPRERQFYIAMLNTISAPFSTFGIVAGAIIGFLNYKSVFFIYILLAGISTVWFIKKVDEPRKIVNI